MKVLLVHDKDLDGVATGRVASSEAGGLAVYLDELVRGLRGRGHELTVVDFRPGAQRGDVPEAPEALGESERAVRLPGFRHRYRPGTVAAFEDLVARVAPDLIHIQSVTSMHPRLVARLGALRPVVWTIHDASPVCYRRTLWNDRREVCERVLGWRCVTSGCYHLGALESRARDVRRVLGYGGALRAIANARIVMVPSAYLRAALVRNGVPASCVRVTPLFSRFDETSASTTRSDSRTQLLFVGRLSAEKGVPQLLAALERLAVAAPGAWELVLAGAGAWEASARQRVATAGLEECVRFAGELDVAALARAYSQADAVVVPSMAPESFGLVGVEAHAHAKPVVAFAAGGIEEWLDGEVTGLAVRHGDVAALAQALARIVAEPALRRELGDAGLRVQRERFTRARHLADLEACYDDVLTDAVRRGA